MLNCKEIRPINLKGNQSCIFIGRTDTQAKALIFWPPDAKNWLIGKGPDTGKDWRQEEKGTTKEEMARWHLWSDGHEFEQAPGVGDGQGGLACCSPWGCKELDMTEQLNWKLAVLTHGHLGLLFISGLGGWKPNLSSHTLSVALFFITSQKCESLSIFPPTDSVMQMQDLLTLYVSIFSKYPLAYLSLVVIFTKSSSLPV